MRRRAPRVMTRFQVDVISEWLGAWQPLFRGSVDETVKTLWSSYDAQQAWLARLWWRRLADWGLGK